MTTRSLCWFVVSFQRSVFGMRDTWYADNRDLVKWGVLLRLAERFDAVRILHVAFYRESEFASLVIDGQQVEVPQSVIAHFRDLRVVAAMRSKVRITVFDPIFDDREAYLQSLTAIQAAFARERCLVFLDPDTGLEPRNPGLEHVLAGEASVIWSNLKPGDVFAFYQQKTNRAGQEWIQPKRLQLAQALGAPLDVLKIATAPAIAQDVAFYFAKRT